MSSWRGRFVRIAGQKDEGNWLEDKVLPLAGVLVPEARRAEWLQEWDAELWQLRHGRRYRRERRLLGPLSLAYGLIADATWLRMDWVQSSARGSAAACLHSLVSYCLLCMAMGWVLAGSWHGFVSVLAAHFFGLFGFGAIPAVFASVATYPLRPLRCDRRHTRADEGFLSARTRWNLFLAAKIVLTLTLCFLVSVVVTELIRMMAGRCADWGELFASALAVTLGMRWALLNQELRCQKCLRMLSEPTRVGAASRNFLEWNGMELACAEGHGLLHVPEMQGSWCWYDRWVELDTGWSGLVTF